MFAIFVQILITPTHFLQTKSHVSFLPPKTSPHFYLLMLIGYVGKVEKKLCSKTQNKKKPKTTTYSDLKDTHSCCVFFRETTLL